MTRSELEIIGPLVAELKRIAAAREARNTIERGKLAMAERQVLALEDANRLAKQG